MKQGDSRMKTGRVIPIGRYLLLLLLLVGMIAGCGGSDSDEAAPLLTFAGTDPSTTVRSHLLAGEVEAGAALQVTVDTTAVVSPPQVADGQWRCTVGNLAPGNNLVTLLATDSAGNQSVLLLNLLYDALSIERWVTPIPGDTVAIGGLVDPGAIESLTVSVDTGATATGLTIIGDDHWAVTLNGLLAGNNVVKVTITHPAADVAEVEKSVTIARNADAPIVTIAPVESPTTLDSQPIAGTRSDNLALTLLAPTATVENFNLDVPTSWSATLNKLQQGKNPFTVSATANNITVTARELIIFVPAP
jgi:hypothetical protein